MEKEGEGELRRGEQDEEEEEEDGPDMFTDDEMPTDQEFRQVRDYLISVDTAKLCTRNPQTLDPGFWTLI